MGVFELNGQALYFHVCLLYLSGAAGVVVRAFSSESSEPEVCGFKSWFDTS